jgi:hypothetical protein
MIILLAMINSLAAREYALQAAIAPLCCAAGGVYAGDGKMRKKGGARRIRKSLQRGAAAKHPRRTRGGRRMLDLPSGHRQPE